MKTYKLIIIDSISIEIDEDAEAKDISRVKMTIKDAANPCKKSVYLAVSYTTKSYGEIDKKVIRWSEAFELRYVGTMRVMQDNKS